MADYGEIVLAGGFLDRPVIAYWPTKAPAPPSPTLAATGHDSTCSAVEGEGHEAFHCDEGSSQSKRDADLSPLAGGVSEGGEQASHCNKALVLAEAV
mmetsp:Transcript_18741/g.55115  ORF Transcript_18741/g.55115 Transcript_18741/m.55115 type:complete len:97 (-) Transcript_18741:289-579(-)